MKLILGFSTLLFLSGSLLADTLFSQMYPSGLYSGGGGFNVTGANFGYQSMAAHFTLEMDAYLTRIDIPLTFLPESLSNGVLIKLRGDNPILGIPNDLVITSGTVNTNVPIQNQVIQPTPFFASGPPVMLTAGVTYWISAEPIDPSTAVTWNVWNRQASYSVSHLAISHNGTDYTASYSYDWASFQVIGTPVPEPSTLTLALMGTTLLGFRRPRKRR